LGCFKIILLVGGFVLLLVSFIRWFEQVTEAVDNRWWNKVTLLVACPFTVWMFPAHVRAGRATPVPRHEPVRGFAGGSRVKLTTEEEPPAEGGGLAGAAADQPPPGTPKKFLELPKVPPPKPRGKPAAADPDKVAKLRQKMRDQGMLDE
jgi:hypothetical protein